MKKDARMLVVADLIIKEIAKESFPSSQPLKTRPIVINVFKNHKLTFPAIPNSKALHGVTFPRTLLASMAVH
jgi:hypothetical protein